MCGRFVVARATAELRADYGIPPAVKLESTVSGTRPEETVRTPENFQQFPTETVTSSGVGDGLSASEPDPLNGFHHTRDLALPAFNIAPTSAVPIVVAALGGQQEDRGARVPKRLLAGARWGLVPAWAKDTTVGVRAVNARAETVLIKPTFRNAVRSRRAVIPASGYYEWRRNVNGSKYPMFIYPEFDLRDRRIDPTDESLHAADLPLAAIYEWWRNPNTAAGDQPWLLSVSILTRQATGHLAAVHDRMPVFLQPQDIDEWIRPDHPEPGALVERMTEHGAEAADRLVAVEVDPAVGNVRAQGAHLVAPRPGGLRLSPR